MSPRVVIVVDRFPDEPFIAEQVAELARRSVDVQVLCQVRDDRSDVWDRLGDTALYIAVHPWPDRGHPIALTVAAGRTAMAAVRRHRSRLPGLLLAAFRAERDGGGDRSLIGRLLFDLRVLAIDADVVHFEFGDLVRPRRNVGRATGAAVTASFRGYDLTYAGLEEPGFYTEVWPVLTAAHTLGEDLRALAVKRGAPDDLPWTLIPPAVDLDRYHPPETQAVDPGSNDTLRVLSVGRLHWKKGLPDGLAAVAELVAAGRSVQYRIVGDGPAEEQLRWLVEDLGLQSVVKLVGRCNRAEVIDQLAWADVFLHPAHTEGFANAVLEAQAMALPVVCTDAEGLPENVAHGETGLIVPRHQPNALAGALAELADDPDRRLVMGAAGRRRVAARFLLAAQTDAFVRFFTEAAATGPVGDR